MLRAVFGIDVRCLAIFRIAMALIILLDLALRSRFIVETCTDDGVLPRALVDAPDCYMSLQMLNGSFAFQVAHFLAAGIGGMMLLVGYCTRIATVICWLLMVSLHARNGFLLDAGDDLLRSLLLWSLFLPLGLRYSVDCRNILDDKQHVVLSPATVAVLLQFACVYFFAGWFKSGPEWKTGMALEHVLGQTIWTRPAGNALRQYPILLEFLTPAVVWFEVLAPICLFIPFHNRRIRMLVVPAFWLFQLGLATTIQLHIFPLITAAATIPFLSSWIWPLGDQRESAPASNSESSRKRSWRRRRAAIYSALFLLAAVNAGGQVANFGKSSRTIAERAASMAGWNPVWSMYSTVSGFAYQLSTKATLLNGDTIDLVESAAMEGDRKRIKQLHQSYRFKYFLESTMGLGPEIPNRYLAWLVYHWNQKQPAASAVGSARIIISSTAISPAGPTQESVVAEMIFFRPEGYQPN